MRTKFINCLYAKYISVENNGDFAIERDSDKLTVYFEWSNGEGDWKNNFDFPVKPYRDMKDLWFCHKGFLKVWKSIEPYIASYINSASIQRIEIIGYSHGGAVAQLCYEYVKFNRPDVEVTGLGFGAPRVFWGIASKAVKTRFQGFVVVRNGNDLVTRLPPLIFGYRHVGKVLKIGTSEGPIRDHFPENYLFALEDKRYE